MANDRTIDEIDARILDILQQNARTSNAEIARQVAMAPSAVGERIKKLERDGVILGYEARLDPAAIGLGLTGFTSVRCDEQVGSRSTGEDLAAIEGVQEVHYCAGDAAYLVKVRCRDTGAMAETLQAVGRIASTRDTRTTVVLATIKETSALPLCSIDKEDA